MKRLLIQFESGLVEFLRMIGFGCLRYGISASMKRSSGLLTECSSERGYIRCGALKMMMVELLFKSVSFDSPLWPRLRDGVYLSMLDNNVSTKQNYIRMSRLLAPQEAKQVFEAFSLGRDPYENQVQAIMEEDYSLRPEGSDNVRRQIPDRRSLERRPSYFQ